MFADAIELDEYGLEIDDAALYRARLAGKCMYCRTPPAPRGILNPDRVYDWIERYGRWLGNWSEGPRDIGGGSTPAKIKLSDDETKCLICDSQYDATIAIPKHILQSLASTGFSHDQQYFLETELVLPICGVCRFSPHAHTETGSKILKRYKQFRFGASDDAFEQSGNARIAREIVGLINGEVERQRQERLRTGL